MQTSKKLNRMAFFSFIFGLIALLSLGLSWVLQNMIFQSYSVVFANRVILPIMDVSTMVRNLCATMALVAGIIALNQINKAGLIEKGKFFAWIGIVFGSTWIFFRLAFRVIPNDE